MTTLDATRAELALVVLYLNKAEARDKICRAIQYGSKFLSNGEPGAAQNVDKSTSLARKVFRLFKVSIYNREQLYLSNLFGNFDLVLLFVSLRNFLCYLFYLFIQSKHRLVRMLDLVPGINKREETIIHRKGSLCVV